MCTPVLMLLQIFHRFQNFPRFRWSTWHCSQTLKEYYTFFFHSLLTITLVTITVFFVGLYPVRVHPGTIFPLCWCTEPFANHGAPLVTGTPVCPAAPSTAGGCLKDIKSHRLLTYVRSIQKVSDCCLANEKWHGVCCISRFLPWQRCSFPRSFWGFAA